VTEDERQAGAEIEITPAMIAAGVRALDAGLGSLDETMLVRAVYTAMVEHKGPA
jgi:hypothetical protein